MTSSPYFQRISFATCFIFLASALTAFPQDTPPEIPDFDTSDFEFELPEEMEGFTDNDFGAAEESAANAAIGVAMMLAIAIFGIIGLIAVVLAAYLLMDALNAVPQQFQQIPPWVPWLLLVPFVNLVVLIIAFIKVPDSLASYLNSLGDHSQGDCGRKTGLWGSVLYILGCTFPIGLVLLIVSLMKINQAKQRAQAATAQY